MFFHFNLRNLPPAITRIRIIALKRIKKLIAVIIVILLFVFQACEIKNPVMPLWDVDLNIPLMNRKYELTEIIEKDSTIINSYHDPTNLGLLYYYDTVDVKPVIVGDSINFKEVNSNINVSVPAIQINNPSEISRTILLTRWASVQTGTNTIVPAIVNQNISEPINRISEFRSATFNSGFLKTSITNNNGPFVIVINRISILNAYTNVVILDSITAISISNSSAANIFFSLANKTITDSLKINLTISTPGSGGSSVFIPSNANTGLKVSFENLSVKSATAIFPLQNSFVQNFSILLDDSSYFTNLIFSKGWFDIFSFNGIDADIEANVSFPTLISPSGKSYDTLIALSRKGTTGANNHFMINPLTGYQISSSSLVNTIPVKITVQPKISNQLRTVSVGDSVLINIQQRSATMKYFAGKLKPSQLESRNTYFKLDMKDFYKKFSYNQLNLREVITDFNFYSSVNFNIDFRGTLTATNGIQTHILNIPLKNLHQGSNLFSINKTDMANFLSGFSNKFPDSILVSGDGLANPNYATGSAWDTNTVSGNLKIEIPMNIGIGEGFITDTLAVDFKKTDREMVSNILSTELNIEISNALPSAVVYKGILVDSAYNFLEYLPTGSDSIIAVAAPVNPNGEVISSVENSTKLFFYGDDVKKILDAKYIISRVRVNTTLPNASPVKFRTSDFFKIRIYGKVNYKIH